MQTTVTAPQHNPIAKSLRDRSKQQRIVQPRKGKGSYSRKGQDKGRG